MARFADRRHAGQILADALDRYREREDLLVLALPRGGVPVAFEVAEHLRAPLDVFVVRKLGVPGHEEVALGALASGGVCVLDRPLIDALHVAPGDLQRVIDKEQAELRRREQLYHAELERVDPRGRVAILVDDGLATGATMRAAIAALRRLEPAQIVVAVPVAAPATCADLAHEADDVVCAFQPQGFMAVGLHYDDFTQTEDAQVRRLLARAARRNAELTSTAAERSHGRAR